MLGRVNPSGDWRWPGSQQSVGLPLRHPDAQAGKFIEKRMKTSCKVYSRFGSLGSGLSCHLLLLVTLALNPADLQGAAPCETVFADSTFLDANWSLTVFTCNM
jgi:hypothetical protein